MFILLYFKLIVPLLRATTLQEELKKQAAALSDTQLQLQCCEQDKAALKVNLDKVTQEGKTQHAELDRKSQSLAAELQKAQQEKEAQRKELGSTQESLGKGRKALKESQSQLDTEQEEPYGSHGGKGRFSNLRAGITAAQKHIFNNHIHLSQPSGKVQ